MPVCCAVPDNSSQDAGQASQWPSQPCSVHHHYLPPSDHPWNWQGVRSVTSESNIKVNQLVHSLHFIARLSLSDARHKSCCLCSSVMMYTATHRQLHDLVGLMLWPKRMLWTSCKVKKIGRRHTIKAQHLPDKITAESMYCLCLVLFYSKFAIAKHQWLCYSKCFGTICFHWRSSNYRLRLLLVRSSWTRAFLWRICNGHCVSYTAW